MHFEILGSRTAAQIPTLRRGPLAPSRSASADALNALASTKWPLTSNFIRFFLLLSFGYFGYGFVNLVYVYTNPTLRTREKELSS